MATEVMLMFEYSAIPPLWGSDGMPELPISDDLLDALNAWAMKGEHVKRAHWDDDDGAPPGQDEIAWNDEGRNLAARLRAALPAEFEVWYWDEIADEKVRVDNPT